MSRTTLPLQAAPAITIGITCYNAADTIERAVRSALKQDWPATDVVAVDDCSTDASWRILQELAQKEPRLKITRHTANRGYPAALNTILATARGDFIAIFDDDDDNVPDRLRAQHERITRYERATDAQLVFCYADRNIVKHGKTEPDHVAQAIGRLAPEPHGMPVADYLLAGSAKPPFVWGMFGSCTLMARRSTFLTVGAFDETFRRCAEWDFAIRAAFKGAHFIAVDRPLITQYKTPSADKSGTLPLRYALLLRKKHRNYLACRKLYFASRAIAHSDFHGSKGRMWKSRAYRLAAFLLAPSLIPKAS